MFLPENIDLANASKYILTIRISPDTFSFLVQDSEIYSNYTYQQTSFSGGMSLLDNIQRIIFDNNFLTDAFLQINVVIASSNYSIIPNEFYNSKTSKDLYKFTHLDKNEQLLKCEQHQSGFVTLFGLNNDVYSFLVRSLCSPRFYHHSSLVSSYFQSKAPIAGCKSLFINLHSKFSDIICFDEQQNLLQSLCYNNEDERNIAYYALNVWEKYNFDQQTDALFVYGIPLNADMISNIERFVQDVEASGFENQITDFDERAKTVPLDILILSK